TTAWTAPAAEWTKPANVTCGSIGQPPSSSPLIENSISQSMCTSKPAVGDGGQKSLRCGEAHKQPNHLQMTAAAPSLVNAPEFTVSELSSALKRTVEDRFGHVRVRGEISGFRGPHSSGHCYFALKDESAKIEAVIWKFAHA